MIRLRTVAALAALLLAAACSSETTPEPGASGAVGKSGGTVASALSDARGMSVLVQGLKETGLVSVFDGPASYTVLAPGDDAFGSLGDAGTALRKPDQRAALAAVLRGHVLPGYTTPKDIEAAIAAARGKPVKMPTMDNSTVTFAKQGDTLTVTSADGVTARFDGQPVLSGNGVAIPIDTVLRAVPGKSATPAAP